jgi:toxin-antitoxin system PIN domain toxin
MKATAPERVNVLCDVSVLVNAAVASADHHRVCLGAIQLAIASRRVLAMNSTINAQLIRVATSKKIFDPPLAAEQIFAFLTYLELLSRSPRIEPGPRHGLLFRQFVLDQKLSGPAVTEAWCAALAIEHGLEWWSLDQGFARFPGLRFRHLLADAPAQAVMPR